MPVQARPEDLLLPSGEEFLERRGPSPLTVKADPDLGPMLHELLHLHLLSRIEDDLAYFVAANQLTTKAAQQVNFRLFGEQFMVPKT